MGRSWRSGQKPHQMEPWRMWFKPLSLTLKAEVNHYRAFNIRVSEAAHSHLHHRIPTRHRFRFWAVLSPWKLLIPSMRACDLNWPQVSSRENDLSAADYKATRKPQMKGWAAYDFFLTSCPRLQFLTLLWRAFISFCFHVKGSHKLNSKSQGKYCQSNLPPTYFQQNWI